MDKLNFYTVDLEYVDILKTAELNKRGFTRVPDMDYGKDFKQKFLCGIVLKVNNVDYYVPVSSFKQQKDDNFLIRNNFGQPICSLRFNYMFPVPKSILTERRIDIEQDNAYRTLLAKELLYCRKNQDTIIHLAERTYNRVILGKNPGLVVNSCDFKLLEEVCKNYILEKSNSLQQTNTISDEKPSILEKLNKAKQEIANSSNMTKSKETHEHNER